MKIKVMCDKDEELNEFKKKLKKELLKDIWNKKYNIRFVPKSCKEVDIYIIISNDLEYMYKNGYDVKIKKDSNSNIVILTSNLKSANIIGCLNMTPYVYYIRTKIEMIVFNIIKIYIKNNNSISNNLYDIPEK